jgi:hypothetical protein
MSEENKEIKEQAIYIVIAPAEDIEYRYQFDNDVSTQVVPVRIIGIEQTGIPIGVTGRKQVGEIFTRVCDHEPVFIPCFPVNIPVIISGTIKM